jgi:hypothetical protein
LIEPLHKNKTVGISFALGFIVSLIVLFSYSATAAVAISTTPAAAASVQVGGGNLTNPLFGYKPSGEH